MADRPRHVNWLTVEHSAARRVGRLHRRHHHQYLQRCGISDLMSICDALSWAVSGLLTGCPHPKFSLSCPLGRDLGPAFTESTHPTGTCRTRFVTRSTCLPFGGPATLVSAIREDHIQIDLAALLVVSTQVFNHRDPEWAVALADLTETFAIVQTSRGISNVHVGAHRVDVWREVGEQSIQQYTANTRAALSRRDADAQLGNGTPTASERSGGLLR